MNSIPQCSRAFIFASIFLMLVSTCSSFGVTNPTVISCVHRNAYSIGNCFVSMALTAVEEITTTDELLEKSPSKSQGPHSLRMTSGKKEEQVTVDQDEVPEIRDEDTDREQANGRESTTRDSVSDDDIQRRRKELVKADLIGKCGTSSSSSNQFKETSVGARRIGSATKARQGATATSRMLDSLRKTAAAKSTPEPGLLSIEGGNQSDATSSFFSSVQALTRSTIMNAVEEALFDRRRKRNETLLANKSNATAAQFTHECERPIGLAVENRDNKSQRGPFNFPGAIVLPPSPSDGLLVRIAAPTDDFQIASLRLSVFSDFTPAQQEKFCERSCQAISSRRLRGACCFIAALEQDPTQVLGTAECSYHEFFGTRLGQRRPQFSILYVTEVAVNPDSRGRGFGRKLMDAVDFYASSCGVETIYLHVDVENKAALALYKKSGFECVNGDEDPMFIEFTTSLYLHPGATKGRDHFLMFKNLVSNPVWFERKKSEEKQEVNAMGTLGFDIPV